MSGLTVVLLVVMVDWVVDIGNMLAMVSHNTELMVLLGALSCPRSGEDISEIWLLFLKVISGIQ